MDRTFSPDAYKLSLEQTLGLLPRTIAALGVFNDKLFNEIRKGRMAMTAIRAFDELRIFPTGCNNKRFFR